MVGVEALLMTRDGVDGDDIASLAEMLKNNQSDLEAHLQRVLAGDYEAGVDVYGESPAPAKASMQVVEPFALTLLGTRVRQSLLEHVDLNAKQYLWKFPIRKEAAVRMLILSALLAVCTAGLLHPRGRSLVGKYARAILVVLASVFIWMIIGAWLQALEGGLNQNFTTLPKACWAMVENVAAKLQLPLSGVPTPTTRLGTFVMNAFIWGCAILLTTFAYPWLKRVWLGRPFPLFTHAQKAEEKSSSASET